MNENEYNKIYLTNLGQGQCYDKETEILTENGWKFFNEMTKEEKVMTLNQETGKQEWKLPTEWQEFDNPNGELYKIELEDGNELRVSEKHKIYASYGKDYLSSIMSSNSLGENTLTSVCFLRPLSPENIGQPYSIASARYGASLKFSSIAFDNLFKNPEDGTNVICFFMNSRCHKFGSNEFKFIKQFVVFKHFKTIAFLYQRGKYNIHINNKKHW